MILYFLPMIIFLGIVTSYDDIKTGKIRNKWIAFALAFSAVMNIILFLTNYATSYALVMLAINLFVSVVRRN